MTGYKGKKVYYLCHGGYFRSRKDADRFRNAVPLLDMDEDCAIMIHRPRPFKDSERVCRISNDSGRELLFNGVFLRAGEFMELSLKAGRNYTIGESGKEGAK